MYLPGSFVILSLTLCLFTWTRLFYSPTDSCDVMLMHCTKGSTTLLIFLWYLSFYSGASTRGSEQSRGICASSIHWPLSLYVTSSWMENRFRFTGGAVRLELRWLRESCATMATSTHPPQTMGERPAVFCLALFQSMILHDTLLLCIQQGKVRTNLYKGNNVSVPRST